MARKKRHNQYNHCRRLYVRITLQEQAKLNLILDSTAETSSSLIRTWIDENYRKILEEIAEVARAKRTHNNN